MTEHVVPMGTPEFFEVYFGVRTPITGPGYTWVGAYPYLDTADTVYSYGEINTITTGDSAAQSVGSILPAFVAPAGIIGGRIDFQIHMATLDVYYHGPKWTLFCDDPTAPWSFGSSLYPSAAVGWNTIADTALFDPASGPEYDIPAFLAALATGNMQFVATQGMIDAVFRVSQLRLTLISSAVPPLRQVQRDDGLGRSALRGRGGSSVQRSVRQRGYR